MKERSGTTLGLKISKWQLPMVVYLYRKSVVFRKKTFVKICFIIKTTSLLLEFYVNTSADFLSGDTPEGKKIHHKVALTKVLYKTLK